MIIMHTAQKGRKRKTGLFELSMVLQRQQDLEGKPWFKILIPMLLLAMMKHC